MEFTVNTTFLDANSALQAYRDYKLGNFDEAIAGLIPILDVEPRNWQARLFLGVCYYKTGQKFGALRAFRFVYDNCTDNELKQKACMALQSVKSEVELAGDDAKGPFEKYGEGHHVTKPPSLDAIFAKD
jgi:tetratricopeptide (TPR) repeat protein